MHVLPNATHLDVMTDTSFEDNLSIQGMDLPTDLFGIASTKFQSAPRLNKSSSKLGQSLICSSSRAGSCCRSPSGSVSIIGHHSITNVLSAVTPYIPSENVVKALQSDNLRSLRFLTFPRIVGMDPSLGQKSMLNFSRDAGSFGTSTKLRQNSISRCWS